MKAWRSLVYFLQGGVCLHVYVCEACGEKECLAGSEAQQASGNPA